MEFGEVNFAFQQTMLSHVDRELPKFNALVIVRHSQRHSASNVLPGARLVVAIAPAFTIGFVLKWIGYTAASKLSFLSVVG
jgi:hypothetical protein